MWQEPTPVTFLLSTCHCQTAACQTTCHSAENLPGQVSDPQPNQDSFVPWQAARQDIGNLLTICQCQPDRQLVGNLPNEGWHKERTPKKQKRGVLPPFPTSSRRFRCEQEKTHDRLWAGRGSAVRTRLFLRILPLDVPVGIE